MLNMLAIAFNVLKLAISLLASRLANTGKGWKPILY
jgi:hypothetical protein